MPDVLMYKICFVLGVTLMILGSLGITFGNNYLWLWIAFAVMGLGVTLFGTLLRALEDVN